jgi:hypothetical protein
VEDILWDYIRRPEGRLSTLVFPGIEGDPSPVIVSFLAEGHALLRPMGVYQGASVFGIAATRPEQIAQPIPEMARHVDYLAPMVYPSLWNNGEYGVADPYASPRDIVRLSLADFQTGIAGTGRVIVPWYQNFSRYGAAQVQAQIDGGADLGIGDWLLWSPTVTYTIG